MASYSKRQIFDRAFKIIQSCMKYTKNGDNQIHTIINGHKATIRYFFKDGVLKSIDLFTGWASRRKGNTIWR